MEAFQFQRSKKKQANEDNAAGEQKNYCLVLNSNDRVEGTTHNQAEFNIPFEFLQHNYEYYKCEYSFITQPGVYKDAYGEFGATFPATNIMAGNIFDNSTPAGNITVPGSKVYTTDTSVTLPNNLRVSAYRTSLGTGGQYALNQDITIIPTTTFTGTMANGSNTITGVSSGSAIVGRFINATGLTSGARIMYQDPITPTTFYTSKASTAVITAGTFTQYVPITTKLSNASCNISVDFGCKKFLYDTSSKGPSGFMGVAQRYTGSTLSGTNFYRAWFDENPSQIININSFSGTIRTRITNGDGFLLEDSTATSLPLGDMGAWQLAISFTPIPSSAIETQCY